MMTKMMMSALTFTGALLVAASTRTPYIVAGSEARAGADDMQLGTTVEHCVSNPDNNCSNKTFYCEVTRENLHNPGSDRPDGQGGRVCCWYHYHP